MSATDADQSPHQADTGWFATTHWSVVRAAGQTGSSQAEAALEKLCRAYWKPIYVYVRRRGYSLEDAQDLTQSFFARLFAKDFLQRIAKEKGKFRSFLLKSLQHFLINERERAASRKRGAGHTFISWDEQLAESCPGLEPASDSTPEKCYEQRWALALFDQALAQLRAEFAAAEKSELFNRLKAFLADDPEPGAYASAATELGMTNNAVAVAVHRLRQRYRQLVREEISHTVADPGEIDDELRYLVARLGEQGGLRDEAGPAELFGNQPSKS